MDYVWEDSFSGSSVSADKTISTTQQVYRPFLGTYRTKVRNTFSYPPDAEIIDKVHHRDSKATYKLKKY